MYLCGNAQRVDNFVDDDDSNGMRSFAVVAAAALTTAGQALAHQGHLATPAHLHGDGGVPIDIGAIVIVGVVAAAAFVVVWARARR